MLILKVFITTTARVIFRKICILRIFTFYNFCQNLGFQSLEEVRQLYSRFQYQVLSLQYQNFTKYLKLELCSENNCNLRNFAFYNIFQNLDLQPSEKDLTENVTWNHYKMKMSRKDDNLGCLQKNLYFAKFRIYSFCQNLCFHSLEEDWGTLQLLSISHSIIAITKLHNKLAVRSIFRKNL